MKLIIQIPCYNELGILDQTIADLPIHIDGVDQIEVLLIDDGSTDGCLNDARDRFAAHCIRHTRNRGLAAAFADGIDTALRKGADIIVNTDADGQYPGYEISKLIAPILDGKADIVIGDRENWNNSHLSLTKRLLHKAGSMTVSKLAGEHIPDAVSGFRAFSREAALKLVIVTSFSYTIETVIQAAHLGLAIISIPIDSNPVTRPSRLFKNVPHFVFNSAITMLRVYAMYRSLNLFVWLSFLMIFVGVLPIMRFLWLFMSGNGSGHIQSLVLGGVVFLCGCVALAFGIIANLLSFNRRLLETTLVKVRRMELNEMTCNRSQVDSNSSKRSTAEVPCGMNE